MRHLRKGEVMEITADKALEVSLDSVMEYNVEKLRRRYPHGFDAQRSMNRPAGW